MTQRGALTIIVRYLFWNLCDVSIFESEPVPRNGRHRAKWVRELPRAVATCFQPTVVIYCRVASIFLPFESCFRLMTIYFFQYSLTILRIVLNI